MDQTTKVQRDVESLVWTGGILWAKWILAVVFRIYDIMFQMMQVTDMPELSYCNAKHR